MVAPPSVWLTPQHASLARAAAQALLKTACRLNLVSSFQRHPAQTADIARCAQPMPGLHGGPTGRYRVAA